MLDRTMTRRLTTVGLGTGLALGLALTGGCAKKNKSPQALRPQAFLTEKQPVAQAPAVAAQTPAARPADNGGVPALGAGDPSALNPPATRPAGGLSLGTYLTVGTVVAEANGQPIYADKVLSRLEGQLSERARNPDITEAQFRQTAAALIREQIESEIFEELEFAAAERAASDEEKTRASALTTQWRQKEITRAGGSLAVCRKRWADEKGIDFDEAVQEQYRKYLVIIHYQTRIFPLVSVTADDIRAYYNQNLQAEFSEKAAVRFRLIKVDVVRNGGPAKALEAAKDVLRRAREAGADFGKLAAAMNDDAQLRRRDGWFEMTQPKGPDGKPAGPPEPRWIERGTLGRLEAVEKAVFALEVGQVTDPIDVGDALYVAKLEQKQGGTVRPFEDPAVQEGIRAALRASQQKALRDRERARLLRTAVSRKDDRMLQVTVDMAMQRYGVLVRSNGAARQGG